MYRKTSIPPLRRLVRTTLALSVLAAFAPSSHAIFALPPGWTNVQGFSSTNTTQSLFVIAPQFPAFPTNSGGGGGSIDPGNSGTNSASNSGQTSQAQFYRLHFPYAWLWP